MSKRAGIWIDHERARIVWLPERAEETIRLSSVAAAVESVHKSFGGSGSAAPGHLGGSVESRYQRRRTEQLERFYERVIEEIRDASDLVLLGPGEARVELGRRLAEDRSLRLHVIASEKRGRLTDPQLAAEIKEVFDRPRHGARAD